MQFDHPARLRQGLAIVLSIVPSAGVILIGQTLDTSALPGPLATHFGNGSAPNGFTSQHLLMLETLAVTALTLAAGTACTLLGSWQLATRRGLAGVCVGMGALTATLYLLILLANRGHADPHTVRMSPALAIGPFLAAIVIGVGVALLIPATPRPGRRLAARGTTDAGAQDLQMGQPPLLTASLGRVSPLIWALLGGLVILEVVLAITGAGSVGSIMALVVSAVILVLGVLMLMLMLRLQVDRDGVQVRVAGFGWPIARAPLADIVSAEAADLQPLKWGGWGYRLTPHGRAVIVRGGPGVILHLSDGNHLVVSSDRAEDTATLVNGLIGRTRD